MYTGMTYRYGGRLEKTGEPSHAGSGIDRCLVGGSGAWQNVLETRPEQPITVGQAHRTGPDTGQCGIQYDRVMHNLSRVALIFFLFFSAFL